MLTLCTSESLIWMKIMDTNRENLPEKLTKEWFEKSIDGEWTKALCNVCEIGEEQILKFQSRQPATRKTEKRRTSEECEVYEGIQVLHGRTCSKKCTLAKLKQD